MTAVLKLLIVVVVTEMMGEEVCESSLDDLEDFDCLLKQVCTDPFKKFPKSIDYSAGRPPTSESTVLHFLAKHAPASKQIELHFLAVRPSQTFCLELEIVAGRLVQERVKTKISFETLSFRNP